jgi:hypothetical protein
MKSLNGLTAGRYTVRTRSGSRYDIDLDRRAFTRLPAMDIGFDRSLRRDGEEAKLLDLVDCTVGRRASLVIDLSWQGVLCTMRRTTIVVSIEPVEELNNHTIGGSGEDEPVTG